MRRARAVRRARIARRACTACTACTARTARCARTVCRARTIAALTVVVAATILGGPWCAVAAGVSWARPASGTVTRAFDLGGDPYAPGQHRGVDLAAPRGSAVDAPCGGRVVVAGRVGTSGRVVTVACGPWHASVMPLARVEVRPGMHIHAGDEVGTAAGSGRHAGIHVGVRRAKDRFGYVDPLRFLPRTQRHPWPPIGPPPSRRARRVRPARPTLAPRPSLAPRDAHLMPGPRPGVAVPTPATPTRATLPLAPWPAWAGVALLLAGASTGGGLLRARRRRARTAPLALAPRPATSGGPR